MNMYHWISDALADYAPGDIIVVAKNTKEARKIVMQKAATEFDWMSRDMREDKLRMLKNDIEGRPFNIKSGVMFIGGSA